MNDYRIARIPMELVDADGTWEVQLVVRGVADGFGGVTVTGAAIDDRDEVELLDAAEDLAAEALLSRDAEWDDEAAADAEDAAYCARVGL